MTTITTPAPVQTIGILGVGRVGTALARQALHAGYDVRVAGSGPARDIELIIEFTAPGATPMQATDLAMTSDVVLLAVPLHKYQTLPADALTGRIVIDAMNYWVAANGTIPEFEAAGHGTSQIVAAVLPGARLVKTLNHIRYQDLETDGRPTGSAARRALAMASDDRAAAQVVSEFLDRLGYDAVDAGELANGRFLEPGTTIFEGSFTAHGLREQLGATARATSP